MTRPTTAETAVAPQRADVPITGQYLLDNEPRMRDVLREAERLKNDGGNPWFAYEECKHEMVQFIGWRRQTGPPELQTQHAYGLAIDLITKALGI